MELLFEGKTRIEIDAPVNTIQDLLFYIKDNLLKERPELFMQKDTMYTFLLMNRRPGVLILINDSDWELEGGLNYSLKPKDNIVFISTLHGG